MRARSVCAAAVLAAAVVVYAVVHVRRDRARLQGQAAAQRLMAGCSERDVAALAAQLEEFRRRLGEAVAQDGVAAAAGSVLGDALAHRSRIDPNREGGS
jgi:uncharacterized protein HemX